MPAITQTDQPKNARRTETLIKSCYSAVCESLFISSPDAAYAGTQEHQKLHQEILRDLANRSPYWLSLLFIASLAVLKFGHYDHNQPLPIIIWASVLNALLLAYFPLTWLTRRIPAGAGNVKLVAVHFAWAGWAFLVSVVLPSVDWALLPPPNGNRDFVLSNRTFMYLAILSYIFPILLLSVSRLTVFSLLVGLLGFFYFSAAPHMAIPSTVLIIFYYIPIGIYFCIEWFVSSDQLRLKMQRARADNERNRANHFIAAISHDLRQPLTTLALTLDSFRTKASTPAALADIHALQQQVDAIEGLVSGSLDLSRLEAGTWRVRITDISLQHITERVVSGLRPEAAKKGVAINSITPPFIVRTDADALERILRNLLGNAIRYTPPQSKEGGAGHIRLECIQLDNKVRIDVIDNGIGIPKEKIQRIFDEYVQLGNPERNRAKGLGLGLAIVRGLAQLLELGLEVESAVGKGSRFSISLPYVALVPPELRYGAGLPTGEEELDGMVILLVDDDRAPREALKRRLIEWGCLVIDGDSADDVIEQTRKDHLPSKPDFILSDFRLQDRKDGVEAIALIRQELGDAIPAAIWSAETSQPKLQAIAAAGLEMFSKPPDQKRLFALLRKCGKSRVGA